MSNKLKAILQFAKFFGLGDIVDSFSTALADGHITVKEGESIALALGDYVAKEWPGKGPIVAAVQKTLIDFETAYETIEPDIENVIALIKADSAGAAPAAG